MTTYVALLRGINVGGRNKVPMADLRALVRSLGFTDVVTYVQSGNLVFRGSDPPPVVERALEEAVAARLGLAVPVVVRTGDELTAVIGSLPFPDAVGQPAALHVTFLGAPPGGEAARSLSEEAERFAPDRLALVGREAFIHCPGGYADTKLTSTFLERRLGVTATDRNWRTVTVLADMAAGSGSAAGAQLPE